MHNYQSATGALPPAAVTDKDGKPLLSWRVLVLPYIEQDTLFRQFHLDEPWDSPHNITLLDKMPATYKARSRYVNLPPNTTLVKVFVGKNTPFEPGKRVTLDDFKRGTGDTLLLVEAGEPVLWTKPAEIEYDADGPLPNLDGIFPDLLRAANGDTSRRYIQRPLDEAEIREMIRIR